MPPIIPQARTPISPRQSSFEFWPGKGSTVALWRPKTVPREWIAPAVPLPEVLRLQPIRPGKPSRATNIRRDGTSDSIKSDTASPVTLTPKERRPLRQHRQHRLRPYWVSAGLYASRRLSSNPALAESEECCSEPGPGSARTLLTVLTVFPRDLRILITLLPARPSRLKVISMPSARRNVCALRRWPARARGFLGQPV